MNFSFFLFLFFFCKDTYQGSIQWKENIQQTINMYVQFLLLFFPSVKENRQFCIFSLVKDEKMFDSFFSFFFLHICAMSKSQEIRQINQIRITSFTTKNVPSLMTETFSFTLSLYSTPTHSYHKNRCIFNKVILSEIYFWKWINNHGGELCAAARFKVQNGNKGISS